MQADAGPHLAAENEAEEQTTGTTSPALPFSDDVLRGAAAIAFFIWHDESPAAKRRLYHEQDKWPIFQLENDGVFYALKSRLRAHLEIKSAEKEAQIAAAARAAEIKAAAAKTTTKLRRRRRLRARFSAAD